MSLGGALSGGSGVAQVALRRGAAGPGWPMSILLLPALAAASLLHGHAAWVPAVLAIVVLGVPHGALDVEVARTLWRHRLGIWWFPAFAGPYLLLVALVLTAWRIAPEPTLAAFLFASAWHFGTEEGARRPLDILAWGGLPIALPVLIKPVATLAVLSAAAGGTIDAIPPWLMAGAWTWVGVLLLAVPRAGHARLVQACMVAAAFVVLPPLAAFTVFFVLVHAPAHVAALIGNPRRAPRVRSASTAWVLALPTTILTVAIGAALWPFYAGAFPDRLLGLTLQLLAAFTLPHMMFDAWLDRRRP